MLAFKTRHILQEQDTVLRVQHFDGKRHLVVVRLNLVRQDGNLDQIVLHADLRVVELELHIAAAALGGQLHGDLLRLLAVLEEDHGEGFALAALPGDRHRHLRIPSDDRAVRRIHVIDTHIRMLLDLTGIFQLNDIQRRRP